MKVLYIGVLDQTGWGAAAQNYILALDSVGIDVAARPIILGSPISFISERVRELVNKQMVEPSVVIQHMLPHLMDYDGRVYNIGLFATETNNYGRSNWSECLNLMDELWIPNNSMIEAANSSGVRRDMKITVIPHASDMKRYERRYDPNAYVQSLKDSGNFIFYTVGEFNRRKNLALLVKAFHIEFSPEEPVELVLKISGSLPADQLKNVVKESCEGIRPMMKLYLAKAENGLAKSDNSAYKSEHIITEFMSDRELCSLHTTCDCFVQPSYGEAWSYPAFDAMAFGKTPIVTDTGGYLEYMFNDQSMPEQNGWLIDYHEEPCLGYNETFLDQCSSRDTWAAVDIIDLCICMRQAYENGDLRRKRSKAGMARAYDFDYQSVGLKMKEALSKCQKINNIGKT